MADMESEWGDMSKFKGINQFKHIVQINKNNGSDTSFDTWHCLYIVCLGSYTILYRKKMWGVHIPPIHVEIDGLIDWCLAPTLAVFQLLVYRGVNKFYTNLIHLNVYKI